MQWPESWFGLEEADAPAFEQVLRREVGPGHVLYGVPVQAIGKCDANDDVLFRLLDGTGRVAVVHLTWTRSPPERPPWPGTMRYENFEAWATAVEDDW